MGEGTEIMSQKSVVLLASGMLALMAAGPALAAGDPAAGAGTCRGHRVSLFQRADFPEGRPSSMAEENLDGILQSDLTA